MRAVVEHLYASMLGSLSSPSSLLLGLKLRDPWHLKRTASDVLASRLFVCDLLHFFGKIDFLCIAHHQLKIVIFFIDGVIRFEFFAVAGCVVEDKVL